MSSAISGFVLAQSSLASRKIAFTLAAAAAAATPAAAAADCSILRAQSTRIKLLCNLDQADP